MSEPAATESYTSHAVADVNMTGGGKRRRNKSRKTKRRKIRGGATASPGVKVAGNTNMVGGKSRRRKGKKGRKGKKSRSSRK